MSRPDVDRRVRDPLLYGTSRRQFLKWVALTGASAAGGSMLASCGGGDGNQGSGGGGGGGGGAIRLAVYPYVPNVIDLDTIVSNYEGKNPGVTVEITPLTTDITSGDVLVQRLILEARQEESSYDLIFGPTPWIEVAPLAEAGAITPVADLVPADLMEDLLEPVRRGVTYLDGEIYSLPTWADVVGLIYRADLLEKHAGLSEPPGTWEELLSTARQMQGSLPSGTFPYGSDWVFMHRSFLPIFVTLTDEPFTEEGIVNMGDPAAVETLQLLQELQPMMPPNANQNLGSSEVFQAGNLVMESYWQAQLQRALTAGLDPAVVAMGPNPEGQRISTVFWSADVVIPTHSPNKEAAAKFWVEGFMRDPDAQQLSVDTAGKILTLNSALSRVTMPEYMQPLADQLADGTPIPMNTAFLSFEQPAYQEQVERMVLQGQSPEETAANLQAAFEQSAAEG